MDCCGVAANWKRTGSRPLVTVRPPPADNSMSDLTKVTGFLAETQRLLGALDAAAIVTAKKILVDCYQRKGRIYTMGNGGSASTAQHFACDLAKYVIPAG